jgi:hypothetical protein
MSSMLNAAFRGSFVRLLMLSSLIIKSADEPSFVLLTLSFASFFLGFPIPLLPVAILNCWHDRSLVAHEWQVLSYVSPVLSSETSFDHFSV